MKKLHHFAALAACLTIFSQPVPAQTSPETPPPCSWACCTGDSNFATACSYYSPTSGYVVHGTCYWWSIDGGGYCIEA